ncbi:hypothetical protein B0H11DRAFT_1912303 [Mycena galericulata]|nr:hypothetical protein B0H11DRAFT_1912303 [Mycena galericulata]
MSVHEVDDACIPSTRGNTSAATRIARRRKFGDATYEEIAQTAATPKRRWTVVTKLARRFPVAIAARAWDGCVRNKRSRERAGARPFAGSVGKHLFGCQERVGAEKGRGRGMSSGEHGSGNGRDGKRRGQWGPEQMGPWDGMRGRRPARDGTSQIGRLRTIGTWTRETTRAEYEMPACYGNSGPPNGNESSSAARWYGSEIAACELRVDEGAVARENERQRGT